jgi:hypothetical protein
VTGFLLDVNVLIALLWKRHEHHEAAQGWFARAARKGWATCALTQTAFVRIVSNPAFSREAVTPVEATAVLEQSLRHAAHRMWADRWGFASLVEPFLAGLTGHRQVTDAYLLGLALRHEGRLATFDQGIEALIPGEARTGALVERLPVRASG